MILHFSASCPGKIVAFGEWAVLKGSPALGLSVKPRFTIGSRVIKAEKSSEGLTATLSSCWVDKPLLIDFNNSTQQIPKEWEFAHGVLNHYIKPKDLKRLRISHIDFHINCQWSPKDGLGSSSALVACFIGLKNSLFKNKNSSAFTKQDFFDGRKLIRKLQKSRASGLDLATQLWGGAVKLNKQNTVLPLKKLTLPKDLCILHTGQKFSTAKKVNSLFKKLDFYRSIQISTHNFFKSSQKTNDWIQAILSHHIVLSQHESIVPIDIAKIQNTCLKNKYVRAIKTTGAGGGDALLCVVNKANYSKFKSYAKAQGFILRPSQEFLTKGLTVKRLNS